MPPKLIVLGEMLIVLNDILWQTISLQCLSSFDGFSFSMRKEYCITSVNYIDCCVGGIINIIFTNIYSIIVLFCRLLVYELVEFKVRGDGNCQVSFYTFFYLLTLFLSLTWTVSRIVMSYLLSKRSPLIEAHISFLFYIRGIPIKDRVSIDLSIGLD